MLLLQEFSFFSSGTASARTAAIDQIEAKTGDAAEWMKNITFPRSPGVNVYYYWLQRTMKVCPWFA